MCGIAGQVTPAGNAPDTQGVERALLSLQHRGPDGSGIETFSRACLGHRRLSVIDLEHSQQPWLSPDRRFCMVFNGEIYNYLELREELRDLGYRFRSDGDTEVLMNMFTHYGPACLDRLNGMFALAIWDETEQSLFMARDRVGKKPLYYSENTGAISFASELGALLQFSNTDFDTDLDAAHDFFAYQFIPGSKTIYRGISKLPPAHYLIHRNGRTAIRSYWSPPHPMPAWKNLPDLCDELVDILDDAVRLRLRSDVPVGVFLSGGLDASINLDSMSRRGADINSFTVGFGEKTFDERADARMIASHYNTRHYESVLDIHPEQLLDKCVAHTGEPFADPSALPTWLLCGQTRQQVTVALSGDGADELFAGYQRYRALPIVDLYQRLPAAVRGIIHHLVAERLPESTSYYGNSLIKKLKLLLRMSDRLEQTPGDLLPQTFSCDERQPRR
jgi:asparagine synthase (glutamine-hydrolysing)